MSIGAVGSSNANADLWAVLQQSMQSKIAGGTGQKQESSPAVAPPAYHRVSGASPSSRGNMVNVMA